MLGFDWVTYRGATQPVDADLDLSVFAAPSIEDLRDRFDLVEGLSGWQFDDILRGDDATNVGPARPSTRSRRQNNALNDAAQIGLIDGLEELLGEGVTSFGGGNILLGGDGSDILEGRGGDDLIDGDPWLNVRLSVRDASDLEIGTADGMGSLITNKAGVLAGTPAR